MFIYYICTYFSLAPLLNSFFNTSCSNGFKHLHFINSLLLSQRLLYTLTHIPSLHSAYEPRSCARNEIKLQEKYCNFNVMLLTFSLFFFFSFLFCLFLVRNSRFSLAKLTFRPLMVTLATLLHATCHH